MATIRKKLIKPIYKAFKAKGYDVDHVIKLHNFSFNIKAGCINAERISSDEDKIIIVGTCSDDEGTYNIRFDDGDLDAEDLEVLLNKIKNEKS